MTKQRMSPEEAQKTADHAREHIPCSACGAAPGQSCDRPGPRHIVCKTRFVAAVIEVRRQDKVARRTPEQDAILASLPRVPRAEIEKCRAPRGGYAFTRAWFLEHGLPYPPIPGWRQAVEREDGAGDS